VGVIVPGGTTPYGLESWAYQKGILQKSLKSAGVTSVVFTAFANGPDLNQALKGGSLDVGLLGDTPALSGKAAGLSTELAGVSVRNQNVFLVAGKGITSVSDLKGKTVATQQGSYMQRYLVGLLKADGLTSSVKVTFLLANAAQQALQSGDIAAYAAPVITGPLLQSKGFQVIDKASDHPGLAGNSYITISDAAAKKYPDLASAFDAGYAQAAAAFASDPSAYYAFAAQRTGLAQAVIAASYPAGTFADPALTPADLAAATSTLQFLVAQKLAASSFDVDSWAVTGDSAK
jgi:ABC-type nitrate/sulfonate/bicarbonate transport system substrate-binding protein